MPSTAIAIIFCACAALTVAEVRTCRPTMRATSRADLDSPNWVEYDDATHACARCSDASVTVVARRDLPALRCCRGRLGRVGECDDAADASDFGSCRDAAVPCDGVKQCVKGGDELGCRMCANTTSRFSCNAYSDAQACVSTDAVCDGRKDCEQGLDETGCTWHGGWCEGFTCGMPNDRCLRLDQVCDGVKDCVSGEDEFNCKYCLRQFRCSIVNRTDDDTTTADCVGKFRVCDGVGDCPNALDETNCYRWREWAMWSACDPPRVCNRTRERACVDSRNEMVADRLCDDVIDYDDADGAARGAIETSVCPACRPLTPPPTTTPPPPPPTTRPPTTTPEVTTPPPTTPPAATSLAPTQPETTSASTTTGVRTTSAVVMTKRSPSTAVPSRTQPAVETTRANTTVDDVTSAATDKRAVTTGRATHQHHHRRRGVAGISLSMLIVFITLGVFVVAVIAGAIGCYVVDRHKKTGKWIPRRRAHPNPKPNLPHLYYNFDVDEDGEMTQSKVAEMNPTLSLPSSRNGDHARTSTGHDSGIDDSHSMASSSTTYAATQQRPRAAAISIVEQPPVAEKPRRGNTILGLPQPPPELLRDDPV